MKYIPTTGSLSLPVRLHIHIYTSSEDVLRARLRTLGVEEYRFTLENGELRPDFACSYVTDLSSQE